MHAFIRDRLRHMDIARGQLLFLLILRHRPGINQEELASILHMDKGTVARGLKKLENSGLVTHEKRGRSHILAITSKAEESMTVLEDVWREANNLLLQDLSPQEAEDLIRLLGRAHENSRKGETHG
jgi:DNA-binding MarR family transcriptional regulator